MRAIMSVLVLLRQLMRLSQQQQSLYMLQLLHYCHHWFLMIESAETALKLEPL
jgi:hypothetical protein